jgi:hypothetical protein
LQEREELLAQAVATFLLETKAIQWYHRQGGVLLLVLALIESRKSAQLQSDMDDPTAKLTSPIWTLQPRINQFTLDGTSWYVTQKRCFFPRGSLGFLGCCWLRMDFDVRILISNPVLLFQCCTVSSRFYQTNQFFKNKFPMSLTAFNIVQLLDI